VAKIPISSPPSSNRTAGFLEYGFPIIFFHGLSLLLLGLLVQFPPKFPDFVMELSASGYPLCSLKLRGQTVELPRCGLNDKSYVLHGIPCLSSVRYSKCARRLPMERVGNISNKPRSTSTSLCSQKFIREQVSATLPYKCQSNI